MRTREHGGVGCGRLDSRGLMRGASWRGSGGERVEILIVGARFPRIN